MHVIHYKNADDYVECAKQAVERLLLLVLQMYICMYLFAMFGLHAML